MNRNQILEKFSSDFDVIVIGGGATGLGAALDSQLRGFKTLLIEAHDFCKGTSSRSTKLIHGGLRYLQQGNVFLVLEALKERGLLCKNAPHLIAHQSFCVPNYKWWEGPFYGIGLKIYDLLAGKLGLEKSKHLSKKEIQQKIPMLQPADLKGGVIYYDGQFDDARLGITLLRSFQNEGGVALNYVKAIDFVKENGLIRKVVMEDVETNQQMEVAAKVVINATGPFCDELRKQDDQECKKVIVPSQGVHIVLDRSFLNSDSAILLPHTKDGRVLFFVPWHDRVLVGTTDTELKESVIEPKPFEEEIDFILEHAKHYLVKPPTKKDVLAQFAGIRPLVKQPGKEDTSAISRDHEIMVSTSGLISIAGGKWTTYRKMAEDVINKAIVVGHLENRPCKTEHYPLHGFIEGLDPKEIDSSYGSEIEILKKDKEFTRSLHPNLPYTWAHVNHAIDFEMARSIEDVLSRRTRSLLLDAKASIEVCEKVAKRLKEKLQMSDEWMHGEIESFKQLAEHYLPR